MTTPGRDDDLPSLRQFRRDLEELDQRPRPTSVADARAQLQDALSEARARIEHARQAVPFTEQEREDLTRAARDGALGPGMREVGEQVASGRVSWEAVFRGETDQTPAFGEFIDRQAHEHMPVLRARTEEADRQRELDA
ncbi:hypothetical protein ACXR2U_22210 [Jatrophihabitans sp. YIM 134969]